MVKFFRKIRQRLLTENKFSRYLIYAFGEIILVVIGILIALQINNWNETRKSSIEEQEYLKQIKQEIQADIASIDSILPKLQDRQKKLDTLETILASNAIGDDTREGYKLWRKSWNFPDFNSHNNTIETLKSSGQIQIIQSKELLNALSSYQNKLDAFYIHQGIMNNYLQNSDSFFTFFNATEIKRQSENNIKVPVNSEALSLKNEVFGKIEMLHSLSKFSSNGHLPKIKKNAEQILKEIESYK